MDHALISPSSFAQIEKCPGILAYKRFIPIEKESGAAAKLGTDLHEYAHKIITNEPIPDNLNYLSEEDKALTKVYTDYVIQAQGEKYHEYKVIYNDWCFGTPDSFIFTHNYSCLQIIDFKSGHMEVDVKKNKQLALYALAIMKSFPEYKIKSVTGTIVQPRLNNSIKSYEYTLDELEQLVEDLTHIILDFTNGLFKFSAGDQCTWCDYKNLCPQFLYNAQIQTGKITPALMNTHLPKISALEQWIEELKSEAVKFLENGGELSDFKLANRTMREWTDENQLVNYLKQKGIQVQELYVNKLKTPTQVEKILKFEDLNSFIEEKKSVNYLKKK